MASFFASPPPPIDRPPVQIHLVRQTDPQFQVMSQIVVLGAGVVGLSTALRLQEKGHSVTIVAKCLPGDNKTIEYTSPWAGAHHASRAADNKVQQAYDKRTFEILWEMSEPGHPASGCFKRIPQREYFIKQPSSKSSCFGYMPGYQIVHNEAEETTTIDFETVTIDTGTYLPWLLSTFLSKGDKIVRASIGHVSQVAQGAHTDFKPDLIVICTGLGSRSLGGVEDKDVFPIRGQTVIIHAPWIDFGYSLQAPDHFSYVIPRSGGNVVLGGTHEANDWYPHPRPETTDEIIRRVLDVSPLIAPPSSRLDGRKPSVEDVKSIIVEVGCGLRPGRTGGIRIESGVIKCSAGGRDEEVSVVYNYGHSGQGYQSSWATAERAVQLVEEALKPAKAELSEK